METKVMGAIADLLTQIELCKRDGFIDTPGDCAAFCISEGAWLELMECARAVGEAMKTPNDNVTGAPISAATRQKEQQNAQG